MLNKRVGRFVIIERLGQGGMGVVYRARDEKLERDVALKVLGDDLVGDERFRQRLLREARAAAAINHPAIAVVYDVGEEDDFVFIAMELVDGVTLRERMAAERLDTGDAFEIAIEVSGALVKAHEAGIVHRDIKPENIMITSTGVKVLDFGIARLEGRRDDAPVDSNAETAVAPTKLTGDGAVLGTPGYMSPEQMLGLEIDHTTDLFALGVTLYEMLGEALPFAGTTMMEIAVSVARDEPAPLSDHFPRAWPSLERTLDMCLAKERELRVDSATMLKERLETHLAEWRAGPPSQVSKPAPKASTRHRRLRVGATALATAVVVLGVYWRIEPFELPGPAPHASASASATVVPTAITALPEPKTNSKEALAAYQRALASFRASAWAPARAELDTAIGLDPDFAAAHLRIALFYASTDVSSEQARSSYRIAQEQREQLSPRMQRLLDALRPQLVQSPANWIEYHEALASAAADYPGDAELHFLASVTVNRLGHAETALKFARRAVELDDKYGDAWQTVAIALSMMGRLDEAVEVLGQCIDNVPTSLDCLADRMMLNSRIGECDAAFEDAQAAVRRYADGRNYARLGRLAAATGKPEAAIQEAFRQAARHYAEPEQGRWPIVNDVALLIYRGALVAAAERSKAVIEAVDHLDNRGVRVGALVARLRILEEIGQAKRAGAEAQAFHAARAAFAGSAHVNARNDGTPALLAFMYRGGVLDRTDLVAKRTQWLALWSERHGSLDDLWMHGHLAMIADEDDAKAAVAARPKDFSVDKLQRGGAARGMLGRVHLLAGDVDVAVHHLRAATRECDIMVRPVRHVQYHLLLGEALEKSDDTAGACEAYRYVVRRWGGSPSVSAAAAKKRRAALKCPKP
jgi:serine/threonine protein kinase/tetratricopeptide (TPR) repeat protein